MQNPLVWTSLLQWAIILSLLHGFLWAQARDCTGFWQSNLTKHFLIFTGQGEWVHGVPWPKIASSSECVIKASPTSCYSTSACLSKPIFELRGKTNKTLKHSCTKTPGSVGTHLFSAALRKRVTSESRSGASLDSFSSKSGLVSLSDWLTFLQKPKVIKCSTKNKTKHLEASAQWLYLRGPFSIWT